MIRELMYPQTTTVSFRKLSHRRIVKTPLIALLGVVAAFPVAAQQTTPIDPAQIDSIIRQQITDKHIIGVSVGIMQNGKTVFARCYGVADVQTSAPVTPATMFAIGSVTKQFTCSAMLMLQEQHKLSVDDPVSKYFPRLTRARNITLKDLGGHLSGYLILGRVIEKVSGQPIGSFFRSHIFTPLALTHTAYEPAPNGMMAKGYTSFGLSDPIDAVPEAKGWAGAAGAIWSTPSDLLTWDLSLLNHTLISPASFAVLATPQRLTDGRSSGYGCGQSINDRGSAVTLSHGGAVSGFVAQNTIIPSIKSALVVLSNSDFSPVGELNQQLLAKLLPKTGDVPAIAGLSAADAAKKFLSELEQGRVDRSNLSADFDAYLTPEKIATAQKSLNALGPISNVRVTGLRERGGMEVAIIQFNVGSTAAQGLMYRTPDGKLEEFLFSRS
jgi:D-alanyl-D-alanine carboxypeptidase